MREPRTGRVLAAVTSPFSGPRIWYTDDLAAGEWDAGDGRRAAARRRAGARADLGRSSPASDDGRAVGRRRPRRAVREPRRRRDLGAQPRALGAPDAGRAGSRDSGGLSVHSIAPWPGDPDRLALAISAAGVWLTDDGGASWRHGNARHRRRLPARGGARTRDRPLRPPPRARAARGPSACSCSSTAASTAPTTPASRGSTSPPGLPSDFGFPVVVDPADPDSAYVIPRRPTPTASRPTAACSSGRRATPARRGRRTATGLPAGATPTCRSCARRSTATGEGARPRALLRRDLGRGLRLGRRRRRPGSPSPAGCRRCARSASADRGQCARAVGGLAERRLVELVCVRLAAQVDEDGLDRDELLRVGERPDGRLAVAQRGADALAVGVVESEALVGGASPAPRRRRPLDAEADGPQEPEDDARAEALEAARRADLVGLELAGARRARGCRSRRRGPRPSPCTASAAASAWASVAKIESTRRLSAMARRYGARAPPASFASGEARRLVVLERELVELAAGVADPGRDDAEREGAADDDEHDARS